MNVWRTKDTMFRLAEGIAQRKVASFGKPFLIDGGTNFCPAYLTFSEGSIGLSFRRGYLGGFCPEIRIELTDSEAADWFRVEAEYEAWQDKIMDKKREVLQ